MCFGGIIFPPIHSTARALRAGLLRFFIHQMAVLAEFSPQIAPGNTVCQLSDFLFVWFVVSSVMSAIFVQKLCEKV